MIGHLLDAIVAAISSTGYAGVAFLMAAGSACLALPSEVIMPFAGYLASTGRFGLFWVATAGAIGCNVGSTLAYFAAARGGRRLIERWGSYLLLESSAIAWSERFFARYGSATVLVSRMLPVVRTFVAVPAGLGRMSQWRFQLYTFVGSWPWCYGLAYVGFKLGKAWDTDPTLHAICHRFDATIVVLVLNALAAFVWLRLGPSPLQRMMTVVAPRARVAWVGPVRDRSPTLTASNVLSWHRRRPALKPEGNSTSGHADPTSSPLERKDPT